MKEHLCAILCISASVTSTAAVAQNDAGWQVSSGANICSLTRTISTPSLSAVIVTTEPGTDLYSLIVGVEKLPARFVPFTLVDLSFQGSSGVIKRGGMPGKIGPTLDAIELQDMPWSDFARFAQASAVTLTYNGKSVGPLPTPNAVAALGALQDCADRQLIAMGADAAQFQRGGELPVPLLDIGKFIFNNHWREISASTKGKMLAVRNLKLIIDTSGAVSGCSVVDGTQANPTETLICEKFRSQTLFKPAHDAVGKAVSGIATFKMPPIRTSEVVRIEPQ